MKSFFNEQIFIKEEIVFIQSISEKFGLDLNAAKLLCLNGINTKESADRFLNGGMKYFSDPFKIGGMDLGVERIKSALDNDESIIIYGDYDADGICSVAILYLHLKKLGANIAWYIPDRAEGYGINIEAVEKIAEEFFPDLIITCDCGIMAVEEIDHINSLGIDVLVTDHHEPSEIKPECIIINPKLDDDEDLKNLCGAGVALKLVQGLSGIKETLRYLDIAAIATVADSVPLIGENRDIVIEGLKLLNACARPGICALAKTFGQKESDSFNSSNLAFMVVPRINAAGRIGAAERAITLFTETDETILENTAKELNEANSERQNICDDILNRILFSKEFKAQINNPVLILYGDDFAIGVLGIVASKITERFNRPVFVCTKSEDQIKGSGRSVEKINLFEMLSSMRELFVKYGGHSQAAGITLEKDNFEKFIKAANLYMEKSDYDVCIKEKFDLRIESKDLTLKFAKDLCRLEPFGIGNKRPRFLFENCSCEITPMRNYTSHLTVKAGESYITAFNYSGKSDLFMDGVKKYMVIDVSVNLYNNRESVKCVLRNAFYDASEADVNDIISARYLDSFFRKLGEKVNYEMIEGFKPFFDKGYGALFITQNADSFLNFDYNIDKYIFNTTNRNNNNKIILSPNLDMDFSLYDRIILLEKHNDNFISELNRASGAKIYVLDNKIDFDLKNLSFDRELFGKYYKLIVDNYKNLICLNDIVYIYRYFKGIDKSIDLLQFCVCFNTFQDLKLLTINFESGRIEVANNKVNLEDSVYLQKVKEMV